jgi:hypothetical protein
MLESNDVFFPRLYSSKRHRPSPLGGFLEVGTYAVARSFSWRTTRTGQWA